MPNPATMTDAQQMLARAQAFYLLKKFTSFTFLDKARVASAFAPLMEKVKKRYNPKLPVLLELNVFGFSRGAAAARLFVHLVNTEKAQRFSEDGWENVLVQVNFVGLFDTVSSEGVVYGNDVANLHLSFGAGHARKVFHLVALDEYRANFAVTTIASALGQTVSDGETQATMGYELRIPGAHSDVGGGYPNDAGKAETETRTLTYSQTLPRGGQRRGTYVFATAQGFYTETDQKKNHWNGSTYERAISGDYYRVGLSLMVDKAKQYTTASYPGKLLDPAVPEIEAVRSTLRTFAQNEANTVWSLDAQLGADKAKTFRHQYLHASWQEGSIAHGPCFGPGESLVRESIAG